MHILNFFRYGAIASTLAMGLSACSSDNNNNDGQSTSVTVSGGVAKGIIVNGVVEAFKISNGLIDSSPIATGTTDAFGRYSLTISNYSGPLSIVVSAASNSQMKCDAVSGCDTDGDNTADVSFGDLMAMPSGMTMKSVLPTTSSSTVEGNVTPMTHMMAEYAESIGLGEQGIGAAIDTVEALFGVSDLLAADIIDITDDTAVAAAGASAVDALKIAYIGAAIAEIAQTDNAGDMGATIQALASNFVSNQGELVQNYASDEGQANDGNNVTLAELTQATLDVMASAEVADNSTLDSGLNTELTDLDTSADAATEGDATATTIVIESTDLDDAKAIVETLRTWSTQLTDLETQGDLLATEVDTASIASEMAFSTVGNGLAYAAEAAAGAYILDQLSAQALATALAGKTVTFDQTVISFGCDATYTEEGGTETGNYFPMGNILHISPDSDYGQNLTFPSTIVAVDDVLNYTQSTDDMGGTETGTYTVTAITTETSCDLTAPTNLADYFDDPDMSATGTVTISGNNVSVAGTVTDLDGTYTIDTAFTMPALSGSSYTLGLSGSVSLTDQATLTINSGSQMQLLMASSMVLIDEVSDAPLPNSASFSLSASLAQGSVDDSGVAVADPVTFSGAIEASAIRTGTATHIDLLDGDDINPSSVSLSGEFSTQSGDSFSASLSATMANASTFVPDYSNIGSSKANLGSYAFSANNTVLTVTFPDDVISYTFNSNGTVTENWNDDDYSWTHDWMNFSDLQDFFTQNSMMYWYTWVPAEGEYLVNLPTTFSPSGGSLAGTLEHQDMDGETASNWRDIEAELSMEMNIVGLQPATLSVIIDRTGAAALTGTITIAYNDVNIAIGASANDVTDAVDANLVVTDTSGSAPARLTIYPDINNEDELAGSVVVNGNIIGAISEDIAPGTLIVTYIDGSFESVVF